MRPAETIANLDKFSGRGAGTDAERRAAVWLRRQLEGGTARQGSVRAVHTEAFWCRPNWALAQSWHLALAVAGSLLTRASPRIGAAVILFALLLVIADALGGASLARLLTRQRASQNVVSEGPSDETDQDVVHLVITANYDAGRCGLVYRDPIRRPVAWLARATGRLGPGWLGWVCVALVWLFVVALLRVQGSGGFTIDVLQLIPTIAALLALALLLDLATSRFSPGAGDNGSGVATVIALGRALDAAPPRHLVVDIVLQGAGDGEAIGLRRYLRSRAGTRTTSNTVVLGMAACGAGHPGWWVSDGALVPRRYTRALRDMCAAIACQEPHLNARKHRGRGHSPALPARWRRVPAIAIGCRDRHGLAPRSHQLGDTVEAVEAEAIDRAVELGLLLVDRLDASLAARGRPLATPA